MGIEILINIIIATIIYIVAAVTRKLIIILSYRFWISEREDVDFLRNSSDEKTKKLGEKYYKETPIMATILLPMIAIVMLIFIWNAVYAMIMNKKIELSDVLNLGKYIGVIWYITQCFIGSELSKGIEKEMVQLNKYIRIVVEIIFKKRKSKWKTIIKRFILKTVADIMMAMLYIYAIYIMGKIAWIIFTH